MFFDWFKFRLIEELTYEIDVSFQEKSVFDHPGLVKLLSFVNRIANAHQLHLITHGSKSFQIARWQVHRKRTETEIIS
jgi:hypothetical protein